MLNVIGQGYIGLPTALMFAANGIDVVGTDKNVDLIDQLNHGEVSFEEKGLPELYRNAVKKGIRFSTEFQATDHYIISVPTPYISDSKKLDPSYVVNAVNSVLEICLPGAMIIIESTISPGAIDQYVRPMIDEYCYKSGKVVHLVHAPERIIPGNMVYELEYNSRTIGSDTISIGEEVKELYSCFCKGEITLTDIRSAEMSKVVENTFRDINIAFANELVKICNAGGMDVYEIIRIANKHPRVNILQPGPGVGGHCISVDPWFLVGDYPGLANIILAARKINDSMPSYVLEKASHIMNEKGIKDYNRVGLYGLTYKENVDDFRESPSLQLLEAMKKHLAPPLKSYDPFIHKDIVPNQYHDLDHFLNDVDFIIIMVGHDEIKNNLSKLHGKVIFDTRKVCNFKGVYRL